MTAGDLPGAVIEDRPCSEGIANGSALRRAGEGDVEQPPIKEIQTVCLGNTKHDLLSVDRPVTPAKKVQINPVISTRSGLCPPEDDGLGDAEQEACDAKKAHSLQIPSPAGHGRKPSRDSNRSNGHDRHDVRKPSRDSRFSTRSGTSAFSEEAVILCQNTQAHYAEEIHAPQFLDGKEAAIEIGGHILMVVMIYFCLLMVWHVHYFLPYDPGFALVLLWCSAMGMGMCFKFIGLPQLLGMLCAGILIKNVSKNADGVSLVDIPESWAATIRSFGLINILMRGGLEMDLMAVKRLGMAVVRLTVLPGVCEALSVSGLAALIFGMPFPLGLAFGFILAAVSPAVVVGGMFDLQAREFGVAKGIPTFVVAAASFDDVVAISGFSMFIGLAVGGGGSFVMAALGGPINIVAGCGCGLVGGAVLSQTKLWNADWKRSAVLVLLAVLMKFGFKNAKSKDLEFDGAGALAALVMACAAAQCWERGLGGPLALGYPDHTMAHSAETLLCMLWKLVSEPLLFSCIGSALDFSVLKAETIPQAILLLIGCVGVRTIMALLSTYGVGLTNKERCFIALAWTPKATVQAALGALPLSKILEYKKDDPEFELWQKWGVDIVTTAVFSILLTAPFGLLVIELLGPRWLEQGYPDDVDEYGVESPRSDGEDDEAVDGRAPSGFQSGSAGAPPGAAKPLAKPAS